MNIKADYDATDLQLRLSADGQEAMLLFLVAGGDGDWVGVTLGRADLVRAQDQIREALSRPIPPAQRH